MRPPASLVVTHNYLASRASARSIHPRNGWRNNCMPTRLKVPLVSYRQWHLTLSTVFWMSHDMFAKCRCMAIPFSTVPARTQKAGSGEDLQVISRKSRKPMCNKSHYRSIAWVHVWSTFPGGPIFLGKFLPRAFNDPFPTIARMFSRTKSSLELWKHCRLSCTTLPKVCESFSSQKIYSNFCTGMFCQIVRNAVAIFSFIQEKFDGLFPVDFAILSKPWMWVFKGKVAKSALLLFVAFFCSWVLICILMGCFRKIELWTSLSGAFHLHHLTQEWEISSEFPETSKAALWVAISESDSLSHTDTHR